MVGKCKIYWKYSDENLEVMTEESADNEIVVTNTEKEWDEENEFALCKVSASNINK